MKTKTILFLTSMLAVLCFFSFKNVTPDTQSKVALVGLLNVSGNNEGFLITYGDGKIEKIPFKIKMTDIENMIQVQSKTTMIANELKERGYHFVGTHPSLLNSMMVFEKD